MDDRNLKEAQQIALQKGIIKDKNDLQISTHKNKRFMIKHGDKFIHFGLYPFAKYGTFIDHHNDPIKTRWRARHAKVLLKDGKPAYLNHLSPAYYSWNILWS